jgi:Poly(hydroxyalcanoate) granule associated protein (phasin)
MTEAVMRSTEHSLLGEVPSALTTGFRRLWLVGLGVVAVAGESTQRFVQFLEQKGEELEPTVATPLNRAGEAAGRIVERAGSSFKRAELTASDAATRIKRSGRRVGVVGLKGRMDAYIDDKVMTALEGLDVPTRRDFEDLTRRVEELIGQRKADAEGR